MDPITLRLPTDTLAEVDTEAEKRGLSRAEYLREVVENRHVDDAILSDYEAKFSEYEQQIEDLQTENERLRREKRLVLEQREEHTELVSTVERQQSLAERKAQAGLLKRSGRYSGWTTPRSRVIDHWKCGRTGDVSVWRYSYY